MKFWKTFFAALTVCVLIIVSFIGGSYVGMTTKSQIKPCPSEELIIPVFKSDGETIEKFVRVPVGEFDDPDNYYTLEEWDELLSSFGWGITLTPKPDTLNLNY